MAVKELTMADMEKFENWLYEQAGTRDAQAGMLKIGPTKCNIYLLKLAGVEAPETIPFKDMNQHMKEIGIPFTDGAGPVLGLPSGE